MDGFSEFRHAWKSISYIELLHHILIPFKTQNYLTLRVTASTSSPSTRSNALIKIYVISVLVTTDKIPLGIKIVAELIAIHFVIEVKQCMWSIKCKYIARELDSILSGFGN